MNKRDIPVESAIRAYLLHHEDRTHSAKTVRWYSDMLDRFLMHVGPDTTIGELDADVIRGYLREVRRRDFKQFTMHAYARTLKTFRVQIRAPRPFDCLPIFGAFVPCVSVHLALNAVDGVA